MGLLNLLHLLGVQDNTTALARVGWAVRRLTSSPSPELDLSAVLDRFDLESLADEAEPFADRAGGWRDLKAKVPDLHPISRVCTGFPMWSLAGLGQHGDRMEAAVTAARIAASKGKGAILPLSPWAEQGGCVPVAHPLTDWCDGLRDGDGKPDRDASPRRHRGWSARAETAMATLSGKTPPALRAVLTEGPLVSALRAKAMIGASQAAVQRNMAWMEARGLIREVTGQGRFCMWRILICETSASLAQEHSQSRSL